LHGRAPNKMLYHCQKKKFNCSWGKCLRTYQWKRTGIDGGVIPRPGTSERITKEKNKCPKGILPSGRPLRINAGDGGWMGQMTGGL
jgi:hypothetical protein